MPRTRSYSWQKDGGSAISKASDMTQQVFARIYGIAQGTLRDWDWGRKRPERTARATFRILTEIPDAITQCCSQIMNVAYPPAKCTWSA